MKRRDLSQEPGLASGCVLAGCLLIGLRIGEVLFRGARAWYVIRPWWYSAILVGVAIVLGIGLRDTLIRIAAALFGVSEALGWFEGDIPTAGFEVVRTIVGLAMAVLLVAAGWRTAWPWAKLTACGRAAQKVDQSPLGK
jgi:cell division protein FtsX